MTNLEKLTAAAETLRKAALGCEMDVVALGHCRDDASRTICRQSIRCAVNEAKRATSEIRAALAEEPTP